MIKIRIKIKI